MVTCIRAALFRDGAMKGITMSFKDLSTQKTPDTAVKTPKTETVAAKPDAKAPEAKAPAKS